MINWYWYSSVIVRSITLQSSIKLGYRKLEIIYGGEGPYRRIPKVDEGIAMGRHAKRFLRLPQRI